MSFLGVRLSLAGSVALTAGEQSVRQKSPQEQEAVIMTIPDEVLPLTVPALSHGQPSRKEVACPGAGGTPSAGGIASGTESRLGSIAAFRSPQEAVEHGRIANGTFNAELAVQGIDP